jgi:hypothetical protein
MIREKVARMPVIDLTGPQGNAFVLLGMAKGWAKDLGLDFEPIQKEATSGDYENLLQVLDNYFGDLVIFER